MKATLAAPGKVRFRIPHWSGSAGSLPAVSPAGSLPAVSQAGSLRSHGRWIEVEGRGGENAWLLRFDLSLRGEGWRAVALLPSPIDAANAGVARS